MWWADGLLKRRRLALLQTPGRLEWAVVRGRGAALRVEAQGVVESPPALDAAAQLHAFDVPDQARGLPLEFSLSDDGLDAVSLPWSEALLKPGLRRSYLRAVFASAGAPSHAGDRFRFDDGGAGQSRLGLRYPTPLVAALQSLCERGRLKLRWGRAQGLGIWALAGKGSGLKSVGVISAGQASLWMGGLRPQTVSMGWGLADANEAAQAWARMRQREGLRAGVATLTSTVLVSDQAVALKDAIAATDRVPPVPADLSPALWLALQGPARAQALDLRERAQSRTGLWLLLGSAFVALLGMAGTLALRQAAPMPAPSHPTQTEATIRPLSAAESARWTELAPVVRSLNTPFAEVLQALRPPKDVAVQVQRVEVVGAARDADAQPRYRLQAEAPQAAEMLKYLAVLQKRRAWSAVRLMSQNSDAKGGALQFQMELTWRP